MDLKDEVLVYVKRKCEELNLKQRKEIFIRLILINIEEIIGINVYNFIEIPPDKNMGDFAFPCFKLAKELKKSPQIIAEGFKIKNIS